jgi:coenzyme F420-0:L-glutamate ligase/coenzyme F420-1:gamma-L-glutamate ligase
MAASLEAFGVAGMPEIRPGDDLGALIVAAVAAGAAAGAAAAAAAGGPAGDGITSLVGHRPCGGYGLLNGDIVVVSSKVISKSEGRLVSAASREPAIDAETLRVVAERQTPRGVTRIVASRSGPVLAAAGVDASNVEPGTVLLLPADPDASARALRARLRALTGARVAVVVSDTAGRPWRDGQVDLAVGTAGLDVVDDLRGRADDRGQLLEATVRAVADELASLADLVKGKSDGVPVAVVRGLDSWVIEGDGPGAASLLRHGAGDWFRLGHVEAVRAALGGTTQPHPMPLDHVEKRLRRALDVALAPGWHGWQRTAPVIGHPPAGGPSALLAPPTPSTASTPSTPPTPSTPSTPPTPSTQNDDRARVVLHAGSEIDLGAAIARLDAAAWSEELVLEVVVEPGMALVVATPRT